MCSCYQIELQLKVIKLEKHNKLLGQLSFLSPKIFSFFLFSINKYFPLMKLKLNPGKTCNWIRVCNGFRELNLTTQPYWPSSTRGANGENREPHESQEYKRMLHPRKQLSESACQSQYFFLHKRHAWRRENLKYNVLGFFSFIS